MTTELPARYGLNRETGTITLNRLTTLRDHVRQPLHPVGTLRVCIVDIETTGLDPKHDDIIELAAVSVLVDEATGEVFSGPHPHDGNWLEEIDRELSDAVTALTGLTREELRGHSIPNHAIDPMMDADVIVSHNAAFDSRFCRLRWPRLHGKLWGCSLRQVDWAKWGHRTMTLEVLLERHGWWFCGHRAGIDCEALGALLNMRPYGIQAAPRYMKQLLDNARQPHYLLVARNSRYEMKEDLKRCGYRWDPDGRQWQLLCRADDVAERTEQMAELYAKWRLPVPDGCKRLVEPEQVWQHCG